MNPGIAYACLIGSIAMFFLGFLLLCDCPCWYAVAAGLAGIAAWRGSGSTRKWALFWVIAALVFVAIHARSKYSLKQRMQEGHQQPPQ